MLSSFLRKTARQVPEFISSVRSAFLPGIFNRPSPEFQLVGIPGFDGLISEFLRENHEPTNVFDVAILNMAVPKSKISPSRKRMKHKQHIPDKVQWYTCTRCGEPKRPHRICTKHMDICALREDEWEAKKQKDAAASTSSAGDA
jgi:large subunit ribosomal protein L32